MMTVNIELYWFAIGTCLEHILRYFARYLTEIGTNHWDWFALRSPEATRKRVDIKQ